MGLHPGSILLRHDSLWSTPVIRSASSSVLGRARAGIIHSLEFDPRSWPCCPHALEILAETLAGAEGGRVGAVMVKVVDFPPVSGFPLISPPTPPALLSHLCSHNLPTGPWKSRLCLRLQTPMEAHQRPPQGRGHPRPDCWAAPDLLKSLVGLH